MNWIVLETMVCAKEKEYLDILNNRFNTDYKTLKEALTEIFITNYAGNSFVQPLYAKVGKLTGGNILSTVVGDVYNILLSNFKYMEDYIFNLKAWSTKYTSNPQKKVQMDNASSSAGRAGYVNEVIITKNLIHSLQSQYPNLKFSVDVLNRGEGDFTIYFEDKSTMLGLTEAQQLQQKNLPFNAKTDLTSFYVHSFAQLAKTQEDEIMDHLQHIMLPTKTKIISTEQVPKKFTNPNSDYYYSELDHTEEVMAIYYDIDAGLVKDHVLYELMYRLFAAKVPIFVTTGSKGYAEFLLASELIENRKQNKLKLLADMPDDDIGSREQYKDKAKDELLRAYLQQIRNLKIIGGK